MQKIVLASILFTSSLVWSATTPSNPAGGCIVDICGPPAQSNLYMTKYMDRIREILNNPQQVEFSPEIAKLFAEIQEEEKKGNETVLTIFKNSPNLKSQPFDGISKAIYNMKFASPYLSKIKYKVSSDKGMTVDEAATAAQLGDLSSEDRSWIIKVEKYFASLSKNENSISENEIRSMPIEISLKHLHPSKSVSEAAKTELKKAQDFVSSLKDLSPMEKSIFYNKTSPDRISLITKHVTDGTVDENEMREILQWNQSARTRIAIFRNPENPLFDRKTPTVEEVINKNGGVDGIAQLFENDRAAEAQKNTSKMFSCKTQYFINKGLLPNKAQVENLKKDIDRSKKLVIDVIKEKFPAYMHPKLIKAVEKTEFIMPPSAADFEKSFADSLRQRLVSTKATSQALTENEPGEMRKVLTAITLLTASQKKDSSDDSNEFCDAFKYQPMSDANYTTYGAVSLSFTTATGDEGSRMGTIMHELGHSVSKAIADDPQASNRLTKVRKCLAEQHTEKVSPGTYVEEDFADVVAGESGKNIPGRNRWCQFLSLSEDRQQYNESKMQAEEGAVHSASLFRLLNFQMMKKGSLPESCEKYLTAIKYSENFKSCLDHANPSGGDAATGDGKKGVR